MKTLFSLYLCVVYAGLANYTNSTTKLKAGRQHFQIVVVVVVPLSCPSCPNSIAVAAAMWRHRQGRHTTRSQVKSCEKMLTEIEFTEGKVFHGARCFTPKLSRRTNYIRLRPLLAGFAQLSARVDLCCWYRHIRRRHRHMCDVRGECS